MQMAYYPGMESCFNQRGTWDNTIVWKRNLDSQKKKFCSHRGFNLLSKKTFFKVELGRKSRVSWSFVGRGHAEILQKVVERGARVGRHQGHPGVSPGVAGILVVVWKDWIWPKRPGGAARWWVARPHPQPLSPPMTPPPAPSPTSVCGKWARGAGEEYGPPKNVKNQTVLAS